jgi:hypothetical protein
MHLRGPDFGNLAALTLSIDLPFWECAQALEQCHLLNELDVTIYDSHDYQNPFTLPIPTIYLPMLLRLTIRNGNFFDLFQFLNVPNFLGLECKGKGEEWPHEHFIAMYDRSQRPRLLSMWLHNVNIREHELSESLVQAGGSLCNLEVEGQGANVSDSFLHLLTVDDRLSPTSALCPKLTMLYGCLMCTEDVLVKMLRSRLAMYEDGKAHIVCVATLAMDEDAEGLEALIKLASE